MACKYIFKGHTFDSEALLDDFLLDKYKHMEKFGDLVFLLSTRTLHVVNSVLDIRKKCKEDWNKYIEWGKNQDNYVYSSDGEADFVQLPYIGVNKFLAQLENPRLFPEFREENYWNLRYEAWRRGEFNEVEKEVFGITESETKEALAQKWSNKTSDQLKVDRALVKERWVALGRIGDSIHNVMLLYFSRVKGKFVFDMSNAKEYILLHIDEKNKKFLIRPNGNTPNIDDILTYAKNLKESIYQEYDPKRTGSLAFFPELIISDKLDDSGSTHADKIIGKVDLLIIDGEGRTHILDYKTSPKDYINYDPAKERTYRYQLATYQRILNRLGLYTDNGDLIIAPIKLNEFKKNDDGVYLFESVNPEGLLKKLDIVAMEGDVYKNIEKFLAPRLTFDVTPDKAQEQVLKFMSEIAPLNTVDRSFDEKSTTKWLKSCKAFDSKNSDGDYEFLPPGSTTKIIGKDKADLVKKVLEYLKSLLPKRLRVSAQFKNLVKEAIDNNTSEVTWPNVQSPKHHGVSGTWLKDTLRPYCNKCWVVEDNEFFERYGIITLRNIQENRVDFIRISTNFLESNHTEFKANKSFYKGTGMIGKFQTDALSESRSDSLMLQMYNGNLECIEIMALLNASNGFPNTEIGSILVINPYYSLQMLPTNEELYYTFNQLNRFAPMENNKFQNGEVKFMSRFAKIANDVRNIMFLGEDTKWGDEYKPFKTIKACTDLFANVGSLNTEEKILKLQNLLSMLESDKFSKHGELDTMYHSITELNQVHIRLRNDILMAIAALRGVKFRQQIRDHNKFIDSLKLWSKGHTGSYMDNPGNLTSDTLNLITRMVMEGYLNVREEVLLEKEKLDVLTKKLKAEKNFDYLKENLGWNQVDLYKNMIVEKDGDIRFRNVYDSKLSPAEKEFLTHILEVINKNRYGSKGETTLQQMRDNDDIQYYQLPLARGNDDSLVSATNMLQLIKEKFRLLNPKELFKRFLQKIEGIDYKERSKTEDTNLIIFNLTSMFDSGDSGSKEDRELLIKKVGGLKFLERNLETLTLQHVFAYSQANNINKVFPLIKAATIHLQREGAKFNRVFTNDLQYALEYIENKILNKSIVDPNLLDAAKLAGMIKSAASRFTLAFSPVLLFYQPLQGIFLDISLWARKPDGTDAFTFKHFRKALKIAYGDLIDFSGKPTLCSRFNELYGLNDMDMNLYVDRISKNRKGFWNMDNLMMKFASRPDYYNRLTIFLCQLQADGCLEAHTMKNGKLVYDWKLDKRFSKYAANPTGTSSDPEFNKLKSLFYAMAKLLENEHALDENGNPYKFDPLHPSLPKAYTNKLSESMKSLADKIYGYYSHEKKSLIQSTALGSLWLQFKTYWSGKKDLYFKSSGIKLQGDFMPVEEMLLGEDGLPTGETVHWYYQVDASGNIDYELPPLPDKKPNKNYGGEIVSDKSKMIAPVVLWKGRWEEGIVVSLGRIFSDRHVFNNFKQIWNEPDTNLRNCYRSNIKQLGIDLVFFGVVGSILGGLMADWIKDLKKENKKSTDFLDGCAVAAANIAVYTVKNSLLDFNFFDSIGSPLGQWTPFAFDWSSRFARNLYNTAIGEKDWYDGIVEMTAFGKLTKPLWDTLKPELFRTKQEGGTWESRTAKHNRERRENK